MGILVFLVLFAVFRRSSVYSVSGFTRRTPARVQRTHAPLIARRINLIYQHANGRKPISNRTVPRRDALFTRIPHVRLSLLLLPRII